MSRCRTIYDPYGLTSMFANVAAAVVMLGVASATQEPDAAPQSPAPEVRYVDLPARLDPLGTHKHVALQVGSRVYVRSGIRIREISSGPDGRTAEHSEELDAASRITRLPGETLVVEPDGTKRHFAVDAIIDRSEPARNYTIVIIPPGRPVPAYLRAVKPDLEVR